MTRVLVVDDNEVYRSSLELLLALHEGIVVVASAETSAEAVAAVTGVGVDVALVDFRLSGTDGAALTEELRALSPELAVICLTAEASDDDRAMVRSAGAVAIVEKGEPIDRIVAAIRAAVA